MWVVGTAGHVDHGKSTLVEALTGTNPDRLKEEKQREMTIELGFAWFKLPNGEPVGIVDVPGHRDFIENMLAGVGGIDAVLFIIAADEGVMPQTREHLAILDLLQVKTGIIVLTKVDLVPDADWLDLVEQQVRDFCTGTILQDAPLVKVSAINGQGIEELKQILAEKLAQTSLKPDLGRPRLAVDRVFTLPGYGTVVTGTLVDGSFSVGEEVQVQPKGQKARIRGIQTYNQKVATALPGTRTALNLAGIDHDQITRGEVITHVGEYTSTQRFDAQVTVIADAPTSLAHDDDVKVFIGATQTEARLRLLGKDKIAPGETGLVQIEPRHPLIAVAGDRFILRIPSPPATIAGGMVLDPFPAGRYKLKDPRVLARLEQMTRAAPGQELLNWMDRSGILTLAEIQSAARLQVLQVKEIVSGRLAEGELIQLSAGKLAEDSRLISRSALHEIEVKALTLLKAFHQEHPLLPGIEVDELKARLGIKSADFMPILKLWLHSGNITLEDHWLRLPDHRVRFSQGQQKKVDELLLRFAQTPFMPPSFDESVDLAGDDLVHALIASGALYRVNNDVLFTPTAVKAMSDWIRERAQSPQPFGVAEFRDAFHTSRKYALAFLEHLDALNSTRREGEGRLLIHSEKLP
jgi:selenocysteine-specific elongation factor